MRMYARIATVLLACIMCLSLAAAASAQKGQKRAQVAPVIAPMMLEKLDLSEDQRARIKEAHAAFQAEQKKVQGLSTPQEKRQARLQAQQTYQAALKNILTAEQQKQLQMMTEQAREYQALGPIGRQLVGIQLSDEQKEKIKAISAKYEPELQKLRAEQKSAADKTALRGQMRDLQQKMATEVKAVLTPEQVKEMGGKGRAKRNAKR